MERIPPKEMAMKLVRQLRKQHPDYQYLKKVFGHIRKILEVTPEKREKRLPELLTDKELQAFYETVFSASNRTHMVMIKLLIFTGVRKKCRQSLHFYRNDKHFSNIRLKSLSANGFLASGLKVRNYPLAANPLANIRNRNPEGAKKCTVANPTISYYSP